MTRQQQTSRDGPMPIARSRECSSRVASIARRRTVGEIDSRLMRPLGELRDLYPNLMRHQDERLLLSAQKGHALQQYNERQQYFEESASAFSDLVSQRCMSNSDSTIESLKDRLLSDGVALMTCSQRLMQLESKASTVDFVVMQEEGEALQALQRLHEMLSEVRPTCEG